jgi:polar amino acid transport system substrate-binding protein
MDSSQTPTVVNLRAIWLALSLLTAMFFFAAPSDARVPLRVLVPESSSMPFAKFGRVNGASVVLSGLEKDWAEALALQMGRTAVLVAIPAKRVVDFAAKGDFDLQCFQSPAWYSAEGSALYEWLTRPVLTVEERLISVKGVSPVTSLQDLRGKRIGVVLGYRYPLLDPLFENQTAIREVAPNEFSLIDKQVRGRADFSVFKSLNLAYLQKTDTAYTTLIESPLVISRTDLYCMRPRKSPLNHAELSRAQDALIANGSLTKLLARYR